MNQIAVLGQAASQATGTVNLPTIKDVVLFNKVAICELLKANGYQGAQIDYNGGGDEGHVGNVMYTLATTPNESAENSSVQIERLEVQVQRLDLTYNAATAQYDRAIRTQTVTLASAMDDFCWDVVQHHGHSHFWDNEGGQGTITIDAVAGTFSHHHEDNYIATEEHDYAG